MKDIHGNQMAINFSVLKTLTKEILVNEFFYDHCKILTDITNG